MGIRQDRYLSMREFWATDLFARINWKNGITVMEYIFFSNWKKFTTLVIFEETNSNISVYKTIPDNVFFKMFFSVSSSGM